MKGLSGIILYLYKHTKHYKLTVAANKSLENIKLVKPTADADTIFQLERIFDEYSLKYVRPELAAILSSVLEKEEILEPAFDFYKIQSLTASKSFGCSWTKTVNGSWFEDLYSWGQSMYPAKNLKAENLSDWDDNKCHIENEGFSLRSPISVTYYSWLNRYVASNTGGSHHAAMVVYQSVRDKLPYTREALIEKISINTEIIGKLDESYYSFIFQSKRIHDDYHNYFLVEDFEYELHNFIESKPDYLKQNNYVDDVKIAFIPKTSLSGKEKVFEDWYKNAIDCEKIISFPRYLENPAIFHKHDYSHGIDLITLGDPARKYQNI